MAFRSDDDYFGFLWQLIAKVFLHGEVYVAPLLLSIGLIDVFADNQSLWSTVASTLEISWCLLLANRCSPFCEIKMLKCSSSLVTRSGNVSRLNTERSVTEQTNVAYKNPHFCCFGKLWVAVWSLISVPRNSIFEDFCYQNCFTVELHNCLSCRWSGPWSLSLKLPLLHIFILCQRRVAESKYFLGICSRTCEGHSLVSTDVKTVRSLTEGGEENTINQ